MVDQTAKKINRKLPLVILVLAFVAAFGIGAVLFAGGRPVDAGNTQTVTVTVPQGAGTTQIASMLEEKQLIDSGLMFRIQSKIRGYDGEFKAGAYALSQSMSMKEMMEVIASGKAQGQVFQVIEGLTIDQVAASLEEQGIVTADEFLDEAENGTFDHPFMSYLPEGENRLEGFLFPDSYQVAMGASAHDVIEVMLDQFDKVFPESDYPKAEALGLDVREVVIAASLIEREAREDSERPLVASVIYNRLEIGMKLEFCSTVQYILGEPQAVLSTADTQIESPYNTYLNQGLPPGPICSPGAASIQAALDPADTDYLYFVLKAQDATTHNFSSDYSQFLKDKKEYQDSF